MAPRERFGALLRESRLYAVTDDVLEPAQLYAAVGRALRGGVRIFQFRDKHRSDRERVSLGRSLIELIRAASGLMIVNDRADLALAMGADGVHLGQDDLPVQFGRELMGPDLIVGASASFLEEIGTATAAGADYIGFGAVFPTGTKLDAEFAGLDLFEAACQASSLPVVGIGGITVERAPAVVARGAAGVAVVSALFRAPDVELAGRSLLQAVAPSAPESRGPRKATLPG